MEEYDSNHKFVGPALNRYNPRHNFVLKRLPQASIEPATVNPGVTMKQAIFHRDYGVDRRPFGEGKIICEKLLQNLEFKHQKVSPKYQPPTATLPVAA